MTCGEKILSNDYADIIVEYEFPQEFAEILGADFCYHEIEKELGVLYLERAQIPPVSVAANEYSYVPKCYGLMQEPGRLPGMQFDPLSFINSGIMKLQQEPLNLTGRGVIIGFLDTGINYQSPVFQYSDGSTRILAIWDQTIQTGNPPEGFEYGSEYTGEMIQEALDSDNPLEIVPSRDENGHGTAMVSVAAGSRISNGLQFIGAAPDSQIVMVKLKEIKPYLREYYLVPEGVPCYQETDVMQAVQYLESYAISFGRPLVICFGIGTSLGDHSGTSPLGRYLTLLGQRKSRAIVLAGGNEGNAAHHFSAILTEQEKSRNVEIRVGEGEKGFTMDLWGQNPYVFTVSIRSPGGEIIPKVFPRRRMSEEFRFVFEQTQIAIDYLLIEQNSGEELIRFRFINPTPGIWTITVYGEGTIREARFDIWLPITQFLSGETYFLQPDPYITLTEPSYVANAVGVSTYNDKNSSFYINSGRGFARDNRIKPDIAAPGVEVSTIMGKRTGSSIASAITAGGVAQLLQWAVVEQNDVLVDSGNIRGYMVRGARRTSNLDYPNREWGYGALDMEGVFEWLAGI